MWRGFLGSQNPIVIDTDAANEIDDQFALSYALLSQDRLSIEAIYAAPFVNARSSSPAHGMRQSLREIETVLDRFGGSQVPVHPGSRAWMAGPRSPIESSAASNLIERARAHTETAPLTVLALAAATNVASAILAAPDILPKMVVVWLGGHPVDWHRTDEFNLRQDVHAARVLFDSGVDLIHIPCQHVAQLLMTTRHEVDAMVRSRGPLGDYLADIFAGSEQSHFGRSRSLWDLAPVAAVVCPDALDLVAAHSPILTDELTWSQDAGRHLIRQARTVSRDAIFADFFRRLEDHASAA